MLTRLWKRLVSKSWIPQMKRKIKTLKQQIKRQMKKELANTMNFSTDSPCLSSTTLKTERLYLQEKCYVIVKFIVLFKYVIFVYIDNFIAL